VHSEVLSREYEAISSLDEEAKYFGVAKAVIAHVTRECGGIVHNRSVVDVMLASFEAAPEKHHDDPQQVAGLRDSSGYWPDNRNFREDIPHTIGFLRRIVLIWKLIEFYIRLITSVQRIFRTRGTIGCATISRRRGLCQHTTRSACMVFVPVTDLKS
jgi:hypothetical protein